MQKMIRESKTNVLLIQETKCSSWSDLMMDSIWDSNQFDWEVVNANRTAGGLLFSWNKHDFNFTVVERSSNSIWCKGTTKTNIIFNLVNIYALTNWMRKSTSGKALKRWWSQWMKNHYASWVILIASEERTIDQVVDTIIEIRSSSILSLKIMASLKYKAPTSHLRGLVQTAEKVNWIES